MIVCLCHRVSDRDIHFEVASGTRCFELLQDDTRVASSCGSCHDCARDVFDSACARQHCAGQVTVAPHAVPQQALVPHAAARVDVALVAVASVA